MSVEAADRTLRIKIDEARKALLELAEEHREREWWSARDLKVQARNGWDSGVMGLAFRELVAEGLLEQDPMSLLVRLPE